MPIGQIILALIGLAVCVLHMRDRQGARALKLIRVLENERAGLATRITHLERQQIESHAAREALQEKNAELTNRCFQQEQEITDLRTQNAAQASEIKDLKTQVSSLTQQVSQLIGRATDSR